MSPKNRRWMVLARNANAMRNGIVTGKGRRTFNGKSGMVISDPAEAREIESVYGKKGNKSISMIEDERLGWHYDHDRQTDGRMSDVHHYTFQMPSDLKIRTTKDNGYCWAYVDGKQRRMLRSVAIEEGYEIVEEKRNGKKK